MCALPEENQQAPSGEDAVAWPARVVSDCEPLEEEATIVAVKEGHARFRRFLQVVLFNGAKQFSPLTTPLWRGSSENMPPSHVSK
jgi:hypothetical protein